jgi:large repetitive protein
MRFVFVALAFFSIHLHSQTLVVNAGTTSVICPGSSVTLGGTPTASGGQAPYTYSWTPSNNLSNTAASNPIASPSAPTWYYLTVTDAAGNSVTDTVGVDLDPIYAYNAGPDTFLCKGNSINIGNVNNSFNGGVTYSWSPNTALDDATAPRPVCSATVTTTYSVIITSPNCPSKSYSVTVTVYDPPTVTACCYTTILEGQTATLSGSGAVTYVWYGDGISNPFINPVTAEPVITTTYTMVGTDANGCFDIDTVTVEVKPDSSLYFYNTFTPDNDGVNDLFYIGNIYKYPNCRLEIYTRTGQLIYAKTGYDNSWDGTNFGEAVPSATYYYTLDLGNGITYYKSVTIIR